jgi:hypothetical protein
MWRARVTMKGLLSVCCATFCWAAAAEQTVQVAGVHFPPYVISPEKPDAAGLLPELLEALNGLQDEYRFIMRPTAVPRRFRDLEQGRIDMAVFENPEWGWQDIPHQPVDMGLEDAEVFVARAANGRDQRYFDEIKGKRLALYHGYHYDFAGFNIDPAFLAREFNAKLTYSHNSNLLMVLHRRMDIALVARSYLGVFAAQYPQFADRLLVSERVDQVYHHYALLRPQAPISAARLAELLGMLRDSGQLAAIFSPYRIAVTPAARGSSAAIDAAD